MLICRVAAARRAIAAIPRENHPTLVIVGRVPSKYMGTRRSAPV